MLASLYPKTAIQYNALQLCIIFKFHLGKELHSCTQKLSKMKYID